MRLTRIFLLTTGLLLSLVTSLLLRSVWADWRQVGAAELGLAAMQRAYLGMKVAEKASAERGPAIPVLNDTDPPDPAKRARLADFRRTTDAAFDEALAALAGSRDPASTSARAQLIHARQELGRARIEVDRVAALPHAQRSAPGQRLTRGPIDQMFAVIDTVLGAVTTQSAAAEAVYPELAMPLVGARYAAELREYAGRLGSQFTTPLATRQPLGHEERHEIPLLMGRIEQLRKLISLQARVSGAEAPLQAAIATMEARYFGTDLPFVREMTERGLAGEAYGLDSAAFVARYVPPMKTIVELRDALFAAARDAARERVAQSRRHMAINTALGLAVLGIELSVFLLIRHRVLLPLLRSTQAMNAIMGGRVQPSDHEPPITRADEIGDMKRAVAALRDATLRSRALEGERERLIEQLRIASDTDFLTGLPNRRAFVERAAALLAQARRHGWPVALLVFDLDHFKRINDQHGHPAGDAVLRATAGLAQATVREGELLARQGGEEFVILAVNCRPEQAAQLAERLRATLADTPVAAPEGPTLRLTASFGLACAEARGPIDLDGLFHDADRALYAAKDQGRNRVCRADTAPLQAP
ncbi:GGDEF domain-containing protein [Roseateles saccharophilus]|uniref:diguanylate cyclase n=1 Tax=Roseateles saccharophilus TaxID=304 RepID=A0A4R3VN03_ROSSA|nr:GGDEF domain-containing protein [Roseateles saccharophilus]MDG0831384.1 GGDEF domain-containing protein [Roseateles saccharophilus]TCV04515.1 diguanylate cyclase (GGDEF)-like protein [Roseateles saccharophilus]